MAMVGIRMWALLFAGALVLLVGCGDVRIHAQGVAPMNVNSHNVSVPVDVRFYQLRNDAAWKGATFQQIWMSDAETLGADRLGERTTTTIFPGAPGDRPGEMVLGPRYRETRFIGILAQFQNGGPSDTRLLIIPIRDVTRRVIQFTGSTMILTEDGLPVLPESTQPPAEVQVAAPGPTAP